MDDIVHTVKLDGDKPELIISEVKAPNGSPMIQMDFLGGTYPTRLKFGVGKAKMVLYSLPEIKAFYDKYKSNLD